MSKNQNPYKVDGKPIVQFQQEAREWDEKNLVSVPGKPCPHISGDHATLCTEEPGTHCLDCPEHIMGVTDLLPWKEPLTQSQKELKALYKERDGYYAELDPIYAKIHALADPISLKQKQVLEEENVRRR